MGEEAVETGLFQSLSVLHTLGAERWWQVLNLTRRCSLPCKVGSVTAGDSFPVPLILCIPISMNGNSEYLGQAFQNHQIHLPNASLGVSPLTTPNQVALFRKPSGTKHGGSFWEASARFFHSLIYLLNSDTSKAPLVL